MLKIVGKHDRQDIIEATLVAGPHKVHILNYGCVVRRWLFDTKKTQRDLVLGFENFTDYPLHSKSFGIIAGRVANRTAEGRFELRNKSWQLSVNNGRHHLHGGAHGLGSRVWNIEADAKTQSVRLSYHSAAGEEGYPGDVLFEVNYRLDEAGLHCDMHGTPDMPTPINLAQHNYYNLQSEGDIRQHSLRIDADTYLPVDEELIPTGEMASVVGTRFDFTQLSTIASVDPQSQGHDHNMCLRMNRDSTLAAAELLSPDGDLKLSIMTQEPGIQLYTAKPLDVPVAGLNGRYYTGFGGICLEAQHLPNSLNQPEFPSIIATPEQPYHQLLDVLISQH